MPAYVIVQVDVTDSAKYDEYKKLAAAAVEKHGGRYIVRGGNAETLEGSWAPKRVVILEFPDRATARAWWSSQDYAAAKALRQRCARTQLIVVDGA